MRYQLGIPGWLAKALPHGIVAKAARTYGPNDLWLRGMTSSGQATGNHIADAYGSSVVAYSCIRRQAQDAAGIPLRFLRDPDDTESEVKGSDQVKDLFLRPAPYLSTSRLIEWSVMWLRLRGEFFWLFDDPARPRQINPWTDPLGWNERTNQATGELVAWVNRDRSAIPGDILHHADVNPRNQHRGLSPLQAARYALDVDIYGDKLMAGTMANGGERPLVFTRPADAMPLTEEQYQQESARLRARWSGNGDPTRPILLDNGVGVDPSLTKIDFDALKQMQGSLRRICHVYGMAPVLIGEDDTAQFKSAPEAVKMYWSQTMVPVLHAIESTWDQFFSERRGMRTYVRFDLSGIDALKDDELTKANIALIHAQMGIPLVAINERLSLGYADDTMAAADEAMAWDPYEMFPVEQDGEDEDEPKRYTPPHLKGLTKSILEQRARDPRFRVQRARRIGALERAATAKLSNAWGKYKGEAVKIAQDAFSGGVTPAAALVAADKIASLVEPLGVALLAAVEPAQREAAADGVASIQELIDGKTIEWHYRRKAVSFRPRVNEAMEQRGRYIKRNIPREALEQLNADLIVSVAETINAGDPLGEVVRLIKDKFNMFANNSDTIARTEVGTLYNIARYDEMDGQGFTSHEWLGVDDEATRPSHAITGQVRRINERFSNGLLYPSEDGGPPEEVINCRCETIPAVED